MLYIVVKWMVRWGFRLFCKSIDWSGWNVQNANGPALLAVNHPNSFLDAVILAAYIDQPVHFFARSDVFKHAWIRYFLHALHLIPIYRIRDGVHQLKHNEQSFATGLDVLKKNGLLLIFVEGLSDHQTELLPLKKGGARIIQSAWSEGVPLQIIPIWLDYNSFYSFGKRVRIAVHQPIIQKDVPTLTSDARFLKTVNEYMSKALLSMQAGLPTSENKKSSLILLGLPGKIIHLPFYWICVFIFKRTRASVIHRDSILFAVMTFLYPFYLLFIFLIIAYCSNDFLAIFSTITVPILGLIFTKTT
jgi:1-acyl-sn-glycerol-3-phosphate acyltransferase